MFRKGLLFFAVALSAAAFISACNKSDDPPQPPAPQFQVIAPVPDQVYHEGDTVFINGAVTADVTLHGYHIWLTNPATGDSLFHIHEHVHANMLEMKHQWVDTFSNAADLLLTISTAINHDGDVAIKEVPITVLP